MILRKASCKPCADITSRFEMQVLRGFFYSARLAGNFPSRRRRRRPKVRSVNILRGDHEDEVAAPPGETPGLLHFPIFERAAALDGRQYSSGIGVRGVDTAFFGKPPAEFLAYHRADGLRTTTDIATNEFARLLAKIGYGLVVFQHGLVPRGSVLPLESILGHKQDEGRWVGSRDFTSISERQGCSSVLITRFDDSPELGTPVLVALIKLARKAIGYEVVVCRAVDLTQVHVGGSRA